jgi:hypothetical protein
VKIVFLFATILLILLFFYVHIINLVFGDSDYILELNNVNKEPIVSKLEIDGEAYMQICPHGKCKIEVINSSFNHPSNNNLMIEHSIDFNVKYNITGINTGHNKKEFLEKFSESMKGCIVYNITKNNEHKIYFCDNGIDIITRNLDSKSWYYESIGIYDTLKNTYVVKGDFKSNFP